MENEKVDSVVNVAAALAGRADKIDQVLVIYRNTEDGSQGSIDNGLQLDQCLWMVEGFKLWLLVCAMGLMKRED